MSDVERPIEKHCPMCGAVMNPELAWWWTSAGPTDTENCARLLVEREVAGER